MSRPNTSRDPRHSLNNSNNNNNNSSTSHGVPYPTTSNMPRAPDNSMPPPYSLYDTNRAGPRDAASTSYPQPTSHPRSTANTTEVMREKNLRKFINKYESMSHSSSSASLLSFLSSVVNKIFADRLRALEGCEIVFVCDDSGSMNLELSKSNIDPRFIRLSPHSSSDDTVANPNQDQPTRCE